MGWFRHISTRICRQRGDLSCSPVVTCLPREFRILSPPVVTARARRSKMAKVYPCSAAGMDCDWVARADTWDELWQSPGTFIHIIM